MNLNVDDSALAELKNAYDAIDPYQPLYGVKPPKNPLRPTEDRCDAILAYFKGGVEGMSILDVGCNAGFLSFYFSDRGAKTTGWDYSPECIEVCDLLKKINGSSAQFLEESFGLEAIKSIKQEQYDVATILSVLHWTINEKGLEYVQDCLQLLLQKVPLLIVELAHKNEYPGVPIYDNAPSDDLEVFKKVPNLHINKIGDFDTHQHTLKRSIYAVRSGK